MKFKKGEYKIARLFFIGFMKKDYQFYQEKYLKLQGGKNKRAIKKHLGEIEQIVNGIEKGLSVLKQLDKYPDLTVLQNQKRFKELLIQFQQLLEK